MSSDSLSFNKMMLQASLSHPSEMSFHVSATCGNEFSYLSWVSFLTAFVMTEEMKQLQTEPRKPEPEEKDVIENRPVVIEYEDSCDMKHFHDKKHQENRARRSSQFTTACCTESFSSESSYDSESDLPIEKVKADKPQEDATPLMKKSSSHISTISLNQGSSASTNKKRKIKELKANIFFLEQYNEHVLTQNQELEKQLMMSNKMLADLKAKNDDKFFELEEERRSLTQMLITLKEEVAHMRQSEDDYMYMIQLAKQQECYMNTCRDVKEPAKKKHNRAA